MDGTHLVIDGKHYHRHNLHTLPGELNTFDVTSDSNSNTVSSKITQPMTRILNCEDTMDSKEIARDINNFDRMS